ncbi:hypothetical protein A2480_03770 [Candidatus Uhrbacteria bacterium RIFOXYC2_FULL_47_19]|uniref:Uncharacterized protein n=1 Tax=Candidatus Uhrbacteria bacterium RIFOXYC2_FULL_47_19 TaxID=1802424 RepID=A0A1F7WGM4_9BACT|nr:MAG: hypothetical protein A2480_03770 [Candidatus Uhrbacteria bacterium RIFOXYC2_FULL_47_19]HCC22166.1 hypothetical protein [Candidatus Uhrbacteria bacterium]
MLLAALLTAGCDNGDTGIGTPNTSRLPGGRSIATLPTRPLSIGIANLATEDALPLGPSGMFAVDGGYIVPDNVNRTVHVLREDLSHRGTMDVSDHARGVTAAVQDGEDIVLLDSASEIPALVRITADGSSRRLDMPTEEVSQPSGLTHDDNGLIVEFAGGERLYRASVLDGTVSLEPTDGYEWNGTRYSVELPEEQFGRERTVRIGDSRTIITVPNMLGSARILGINEDGDAFVLVEDVAFLPEVSVEQTVWKISPDGTIIETARVPYEESEVRGSFGVTVGHDDEPVVMTTSVDRLNFWHVTPVAPEIALSREPTETFTVSRDDPEEQPLDENSGVARSALYTYSGSCLTSSQMLSNINEYGNVYRYLSSSNIYYSSWCSGREAPSYLGSPRYYSSVSYDWGGFDTPSGFSNAMSSGYKAGNMNTSYVLSCSYGVDCSGFVSRIWGLTYKLSTSSIPSYSTAAYGPTYQLGEVFNYPGNHVVVFAGSAYNGIFAYEATALNNYDRVVYTYRTWSSLSGYSARRSNTMC